MSHGRVLVVDDEDVLCETMRLCLESAGFAVSVAHTTESALAQLSAEEFDAVVLDVPMPHVDGAELVRCIRDRDLAGEIIVAASAASRDLGLEALRLGACELLRKPILNLEEKLVRSVSQAAERHRMRKTLRLAEARAADLERRMNELCQYGRAVLHTEDDHALVRTLQAAVGALHRPVPHILFRTEGTALVQLGVRNGLRLPRAEDAFAAPAHAGLPLPPAVDVFPLACGKDVLGALAVGGLESADSDRVVPLLALLPALTCRLLAARDATPPAASAPR